MSLKGDGEDGNGRQYPVRLGCAASENSLSRWKAEQSEYMNAHGPYR